MSARFTIGKSIHTRLPVYIDDAKNGLDCDCLCYNCNEKLLAIQGKSENSKAWHFRHYNSTSKCPGDRSRALHEYAKHILVESASINTKKKRIQYSNPRKEVTIGLFRSDVAASSLLGELHFEVVVNHDFLNTQKEFYYSSNRIHCIRIDLTDPNLLKATPEAIKNAVLEDISNKDFIDWHRNDPYNAPVNTERVPENWILITLAILTSLFLFRSSVFPGRRRKFKRGFKNSFKNYR